MTRLQRRNKTRRINLLKAQGWQLIGGAKFPGNVRIVRLPLSTKDQP